MNFGAHTDFIMISYAIVIITLAALAYVSWRKPRA